MQTWAPTGTRAEKKLPSRQERKKSGRTANFDLYPSSIFLNSKTEIAELKKMGFDLSVISQLQSGVLAAARGSLIVFMAFSLTL